MKELRQTLLKASCVGGVSSHRSWTVFFAVLRKLACCCVQVIMNFTEHHSLLMYGVCCAKQGTSFLENIPYLLGHPDSALVFGIFKTNL